MWKVQGNEVLERDYHPRHGGTARRMSAWRARRSVQIADGVQND